MILSARLREWPSSTYVEVMFFTERTHWYHTMEAKSAKIWQLTSNTVKKKMLIPFGNSKLQNESNSAFTISAEVEQQVRNSVDISTTNDDKVVVQLL